MSASVKWRLSGSTGGNPSSIQSRSASSVLMPDSCATSSDVYFGWPTISSVTSFAGSPLSTITTLNHFGRID